MLFPREQANIVPKISAPIRRFLVNRGDHVKAGQLLAELENSDLVGAAQESRGQFVQAESNLRATTGVGVPEQVTKAQADVDAARESLDAAKKLLDSRQRLFKEGALAHKQVDEAQVQYAQAKAAFDSALQHLQALETVGKQELMRAAQAQVESARGRHDQRAGDVVLRRNPQPLQRRRHRPAALSGRNGHDRCAAPHRDGRVEDRGAHQHGAGPGEGHQGRRRGDDDAVDGERAGARQGRGGQPRVRSEQHDGAGLGAGRQSWRAPARRTVGPRRRSSPQRIDGATLVPASAILADDEGATIVKVVDDKNIAHEQAGASRRPGARDGAGRHRHRARRARHQGGRRRARGQGAGAGHEAWREGERTDEETDEGKEDEKDEARRGARLSRGRRGEHWTARHGKPIIFVILTLVAVGVYLATTIPVAVFPEVDFPRILVGVDNGVAPIDQMQVMVTRPLEEAVNSVQGLEVVRSTTSRGTAEIDLFFSWNVDMFQTLARVNAAIAQVQTELPSTVKITTNRLTFAAFPIMGYSLTSDTVPQTRLWELATYELKPRLNRMNGVSTVVVQGGQVPEFESGRTRRSCCRRRSRSPTCWTRSDAAI